MLKALPIKITVDAEVNQQLYLVLKALPFKITVDAKVNQQLYLVLKALSLKITVDAKVNQQLCLVSYSRSSSSLQHRHLLPGLHRRDGEGQGWRRRGNLLLRNLVGYHYQ